jgi:hypothetical protein
MCAWAGGSFTKGNAGTGGWVGDASLGIGIEAGRHDTQDNDFATGINQCINKDGSNAFTADPNLGGFKPTNLAAGTAAAPALCVGGDVNTGVFGPAADTWAVATNGTERVRVDSTGQIGIGTTSPASVLDVQASLAFPIFTTFANSAVGASLRLQKSRSATVGTNTIVQNGDGVGDVYFFGANGTGYTECALIRASIDGTPGATNDMPGRLSFFTTPDGSGAVTERMRILSNGVVCVGTATSFIGTAGGLCIQGGGATGATYSFATSNSASALSFSIANDGAIRTGALTNSPFNQTTGLGANMYVNAVGDLFRSTSSLKYKTDVVDYDKGLAEVLQIQPKYYKATNSGEQVFAGLIAEQIDEVGLSEFVQYAPDESPDAISYGHMAALFTKAIQELNAKVEALQARVDELEAA